MGSVYRSAMDGSLVLYEQGNRIYLRTLMREGMGRATVLAADYSSDLTDVLWQGTVYYAYKNTEGDILIKSIAEHRVLYHLSEMGGPEGFAPQLTVAAGELVLIYSVQNPLDGMYGLHWLFPFATEAQTAQTGNAAVQFEEQFSRRQDRIPKLQILSCRQGNVFVWERENDMKICWLDEEMVWHRRYSDDEEVARGAEDRSYLDQWNQERQNWEEERQDYVREIEQSLRQVEDLQHELEVGKKQDEFYQKELLRRDLLIESIKQQYEDLMKVAEQYRQEAIKWRSKFVR